MGGAPIGPLRNGKCFGTPKNVCGDSALDSPNSAPYRCPLPMPVVCPLSSGPQFYRQDGPKRNPPKQPRRSPSRGIIEGHLQGASFRGNLGFALNLRSPLGFALLNWGESKGCLIKGCLNSAKIPKVGIPKAGIPKTGIPKGGIPKVGQTHWDSPPRQRFQSQGIPKSGIPKTGIPKAGIPKLGIPKTGRFTAPLIQTPLRLPLIKFGVCVIRCGHDGNQTLAKKKSSIAADRVLQYDISVD